MEKTTKRMYILLVRSKSLPSKLIGFLAREGYTHAALSFSSDCTELYSFARKYQNLPLPGSFAVETIYSGFLGKYPKTPCALYSFDVTEDICEKIYADIMEVNRKRKIYKYNYLGLFLCWFGIKRVRKNKYFCSEFVAHTLKNAGALDIKKHPSVFRPGDFQEIPELDLIYEGNIEGLRNRTFINKI